MRSDTGERCRAPRARRGAGQQERITRRGTSGVPGSTKGRPVRGQTKCGTRDRSGPPPAATRITRAARAGQRGVATATAAGKGCCWRGGGGGGGAARRRLHALGTVAGKPWAGATGGDDVGSSRAPGGEVRSSATGAAAVFSGTEARCSCSCGAEQLRLGSSGATSTRPDTRWGAGGRGPAGGRGRRGSAAGEAAPAAAAPPLPRPPPATAGATDAVLGCRTGVGCAACCCCCGGTCGGGGSGCAAAASSRPASAAASSASSSSCMSAHLRIAAGLGAVEASSPSTDADPGGSEDAAPTDAAAATVVVGSLLLSGAGAAVATSATGTGSGSVSESWEAAGSSSASAAAAARAGSSLPSRGGALCALSMHASPCPARLLPLGELPPLVPASLKTTAGEQGICKRRSELVWDCPATRHEHTCARGEIKPVGGSPVTKGEVGERTRALPACSLVGAAEVESRGGGAGGRPRTVLLRPVGCVPSAAAGVAAAGAASVAGRRGGPEGGELLLGLQGGQARWGGAGAPALLPVEARPAAPPAQSASRHPAATAHVVQRPVESDRIILAR